jgi:hypothetical protein
MILETSAPKNPAKTQTRMVETPAEVARDLRRVIVLPVYAVALLLDYLRAT